MSKVLVWVSVVLVGIWGGKQLVDYMSRTAHERAASERVSSFLQGMRAGGDYQAAFSMWKTGGTGALQETTQEEYNADVGRLQAWFSGRGLGRNVERFETLEARMVAAPEGLNPAVVEVSCTMNGRPFTIRVVPYEQLQWVE